MKNNVPRHVAVIPDGNRRWAKSRGLPPYEGHRKGFKAALEIGKEARRLGIKTLTFWAFSTENWKRSKIEVDFLMNFFFEMANEFYKEAVKHKVRIVHLGRKDRINKKLRARIEEIEYKTRHNSSYYLALALDYGGRDEILRAVDRMGKKTKQAFVLSEDEFSSYLDTRDLPDPNPDLIIRTSGEMRTSGCLIWQAAYAEFISVKKHFPDFTPRDFAKCIEEFKRRSRRFGV